MIQLLDYLTISNLSLIFVGIAIATFASLVGIGGGLLWAPYLILVAKFDAQNAVTVSFLIQLVGMGSATVENIRTRSIFWKLVIVLLPLLALGVVGGSILSERFAESHYIEMGLGISGIIVSLIFAFQAESYDANLILERDTKPPWWLLPVASLFATVSGLFSVGIGDFLIPVIRGKMKIPMKYTVGTSLLLNFFVALIGAITHIYLLRFTFTPNVVAFLAFSWAGVVVGGQIGPRLAKRIADNRLKEIFIFVLLLIGIHLIYQSL